MSDTEESSALQGVVLDRTGQKLDSEALGGAVPVREPATAPNPALAERLEAAVLNVRLEENGKMTGLGALPPLSKGPLIGW
jgi:hypothetical protein